MSALCSSSAPSTRSRAASSQLPEEREAVHSLEPLTVVRGFIECIPHQLGRVGVTSASGMKGREQGTLGSVQQIPVQAVKFVVAAEHQQRVRTVLDYSGVRGLLLSGLPLRRGAP